MFFPIVAVNGRNLDDYRSGRVSTRLGQQRFWRETRKYKSLYPKDNFFIQPIFEILSSYTYTYATPYTQLFWQCMPVAISHERLEILAATIFVGRSSRRCADV